MGQAAGKRVIRDAVVQLRQLPLHHTCTKEAREDTSVEITITGRHVEVSDEVRAYLEEKANKLPRFYDRIISMEAVFDHESDQFKAELIVRADKKHTFVAHDSGPDTFALIDAIVEKLERQLRDHKSQRRNRKHDGKSAPPPVEE